MGSALRTFAGCAVANVVAGAGALTTRRPWLFLSFRPTVMLRVEKPAALESSVLQGVLSAARVVTAGSLAVTTLVLVLLHDEGGSGGRPDR
jgi:hypothetical protein